MRWNARITDTAKLSYERRILLLDRVEFILDNLDILRARAIQYASDESVGIIAPSIQLPKPLEDEEQELADPAKLGDFPWLIETSLVSEVAFILSNDRPSVEDHDDGDGDDNWHDIRETWFESLMKTLNEEDALPDYDIKDFEGDIVMRDCPDCSDYDDSDDTFVADGGEHGMKPSQGTEILGSLTGSLDTDAQNDMLNPEEHVFLKPWNETFPYQLREFLDFLDDESQRSQEALHQHYSLEPIQLSRGYGPSYCKATESGLETHSSGSLPPSPINRYLEDSIQYPPPVTHHTITVEHLVRLQRDIEQIHEFRARMQQNMWEVREALNRREDRYRMRQNHGDITMVMRSRGFGSPLARGTSAYNEGTKIAGDWDEHEDEDERWGLPPVQTPRRKLFMSSLAPGLAKKELRIGKENTVVADGAAVMASAVDTVKW